MTPEALEALVRAADPGKLAEAVAPLTEQERKKLSTFAGKLWRAIEKQFWDTDFLAPADGLVTRVLGRGRDRVSDDVRSTAMLAAVAVCPISRLKSATDHLSAPFERAFAKILTDRRPEWIDDFVARQLESEMSTIGWTVLRQLIRDGVCRKPTTDGYIRLMTRSLPWEINRPRTRRAISDLLREDPELLEDEVWRLFTVETTAFVYDWEGPDGEDESWKSALVKLTEEGLLDRSRMLDECLAGLSGGFKNNLLSAFIKLFDRLKPTPEEIAARQSVLIDLLSSGASHVLTFALKGLKALDKRNELDDDAFLAAVGRTFDVRPKSQPKAALALVHRIAKRNPARTADGARLAIRALGHAASDVQEKALDALEVWADTLDDAMTGSLAERLEDVAPAHRVRVGALVRQARGAVTPDGDSSRDRPAELPAEMPAESPIERDVPMDRDAESDRAALQARAEALPADLRARAGVDDALSTLDAPPSGAADSTSPLPPIDVRELPVLAHREPIEPIASVEALIEAVAHAVETVDSAEEVERILDGLSRLGAEKPADFRRRTAPLLQRIAGGLAIEGARGIVSSWGGPAEMGVLLELWITGKRRRLKGLFESGAVYRPKLAPGIEVARRRLEELIDRLRRREAAPLLAAPTHRHAWLDPRALVARVSELETRRLDVPPFDFTQALLRLAPDRRAEALEDAASLRSDAGRILRFALGGDEAPTRRDRRNRTLWLAAGRARSPQGTLDALRVLKIDERLPDAIVPVTNRWRACVVEEKDHANRKYKTYKLDVETDPPPRQAKDVAAMPTVALHARPDRWATFGMHTAWLTQWVAMTWPLDLGPYFVMGVRALAGRVDMQSSSFEPNFPYFEPLFEPDRSWSEMAQLTLWLGLVGRDADARGLAIDALIEAIQDGRADPVALGDVLTRLADGGWVKLNRLAEALGEIARVSPHHALFVCAVLERLIAAYEDLPRDFHHVLSLLRDLSIELGRSPASSARERLTSLAGSSKTAKLARDLLGLTFDGASAVLAKARLQAAEARVGRAERWAKVGVEATRRCPDSRATGSRR